MADELPLPPPPEPLADLGETSLLEVVDHALNKGVVLTGEATIAIANIDLIYLGLNLVLGSAQTIRDSGRTELLPWPGVPRPEPASGPEPGPAPVEARSRLNPLPQGEGTMPAPAGNVLRERTNLAPDNVEQGLAKLVLSLIEFLRRVLERQAVRRMDGGDLSDADIERMGLTLMRLEEKVLEMAGQFGLQPEDLNLDLGPLGKLL